MRKLLLGIGLLLAANNAIAEGMKNHEFLELPDMAKKFWIQGAVELMSATVHFNDKTQGKCIIDWYYQNNIAKRNGLILGSMNKYPQATPIVTIIALVELSCGKIDTKNVTKY